MGGDVQAIAATNTEVYIGGHFRNALDPTRPRRHLASFRVADGSITDRITNADGIMGVWTITITPTALAIGGDFDKVRGAGPTRIRSLPRYPLTTACALGQRAAQSVSGRRSTPAPPAPPVRRKRPLRCDPPSRTGGQTTQDGLERSNDLIASHLPDGSVATAVAATAAGTAPSVAAAPDTRSTPPPTAQRPDAALKALLAEIDADRIEASIRELVSFGTRHTLSSQRDPDPRHRRGP